MWMYQRQKELMFGDSGQVLFDLRDELPYFVHLDIYILVLRVVYLSFFLIERWQFRRWQWRRRGERGARQQGLRECFEICSGGRRERHLQHMLARTHRDPAASFWQSERCVCKFHWFILPPKMWLKSRFCVWQEPDTSDFLFSHNFNNRAPDSAINQWLHNPVPTETPTPNQSAAFLFGPLQILLMLFCVCAPSSCHNMVLYAYSVVQMRDFYSEKLPMLVSCDPNMPTYDISILVVFLFFFYNY